MNLHQEIEARLGGPTQSGPMAARYIGAVGTDQRQDDEKSRLVYWGHSAGAVRDATKAKYSFTELSDDKQWKIWQAIWKHSAIFEAKSVALSWLSAPARRRLRLEKWRDLVAMAAQIDNWAHSDGLSSVLAEALEEHPALFDIFKKWNRSRNPWLRRQSLVGIYYYARGRKVRRPASQSLPMVKALLRDPHFYVQRAVGWTLREIDRVDSAKQRAFVRKHLHEISSTAWFATSELYPVSLRQELVQRRRLQRGSAG